MELTETDSSCAIVFTFIPLIERTYTTKSWNGMLPYLVIISAYSLWNESMKSTTNVQAISFVFRDSFAFTSLYAWRSSSSMR